MKQFAKIVLVLILIVAIIGLGSCGGHQGKTVKIDKLKASGILTDIDFYGIKITPPPYAAIDAAIVFDGTRGYIADYLYIIGGNETVNETYILGRQYYLYLYDDFGIIHVLSPNKLEVGKEYRLW